MSIINVFNPSRPPPINTSLKKPWWQLDKMNHHWIRGKGRVSRKFPSVITSRLHFVRVPFILCGIYWKVINANLTCSGILSITFRSLCIFAYLILKFVSADAQGWKMLGCGGEEKILKTLLSLHFISNYAGNSFSFASFKLQLKSSCCWWEEWWSNLSFFFFFLMLRRPSKFAAMSKIRKNI